MPKNRIFDFALALAVAGGVAFGAAGVPAETIEDWPCKQPYVESLSAESIWEGTPPPAGGDWRDNDEVSRVVYYATNPENNPDLGRDAIAEFARNAGPDKARLLALVFRGLLEETNTYRQVVVAGIRNFTIRAKILEDAVAKNDAALAELPEAATDDRRDVRLARMWNLRNLDDAEEEADFQCRRLGYLEKKLRRLTDRLRAEMPSR